MIYTGYFKDINDVDYTVKITTSTGNQTREITLGGNPFITEMDGSSDNIYVPAKYQTATVSVISPEYLFDVYTGTNVKEDEKSIAYKLTFSDNTRTLEEDEVMEVFKRIIDEVTTKCNAVLRDK